MKFEGCELVPGLEFDEDIGCIKIYGRSIDIDVRENFWDPLSRYLDKYLKEPKDITLSVDLEYFSTTSSKCMMMLFKQISEKIVKEHNKKFIVEWLYEDDDDLEEGEDYQSITPGAEFKFIKK